MIVTITTVGYGDKYPVTNPGRIVGVLIMVVGVGLFGVLTGFLANVFLAPRTRSPTRRRQTSLVGNRRADQPLEPAQLPVSVGLTAQLDQLSAEVASLRRLLERLPAAHVTGPDAPEDPPNLRPE